MDIEDLLGRDQVDARADLLQHNIQGKIVLITGAGGSIGSELCRQALLQQPEKLILLELNEYSLYAIEQELQQLNEQHQLNVPIISILGSVQKQNRLETVFRTFPKYKRFTTRRRINTCRWLNIMWLKAYAITFSVPGTVQKPPSPPE